MFYYIDLSSVCSRDHENLYQKLIGTNPNQNLAYNKMIENANSIVTASKQSLFLLNYSKWINHFHMKPLYSLFFHSSLHIEEHILWIKLYLSTKRCFFSFRSSLFYSSLSLKPFCCNEMSLSFSSLYHSV